jgi:RNA-directed DNA polymerase
VRAIACFNDGSLGLSWKSTSRFEGTIRQLTRRNKPGRFEELIARLNQTLTGWINYYRYLRSDARLKQLDGWIRRKLRGLKLKQLKRRYTTAKFYMRHGVPEYQAWIGALSGKGLWRRSAIPQSHQAMNLTWFEELGRVSLSQRWRDLATKP